jgi:sulfur transfer protein SufE
MENKQMTFDEKIKEYKEHLEALKEIDSLEVYQWLISLGKQLSNDPLSKERHTEDNRVSRCQYDLFVDKENDKFKAWSNAMIAGGYAYILVDIFNSMTEEESKKITVEDFKKMKLDEMLTMNRQTGFYQMIEMMLNKGESNV